MKPVPMTHDDKSSIDLLRRKKSLDVGDMSACESSSEAVAPSGGEKVKVNTGVLSICTMDGFISVHDEMMQGISAAYIIMRNSAQRQGAVRDTSVELHGSMAKRITGVLMQYGENRVNRECRLAGEFRLRVSQESVRTSLRYTKTTNLPAKFRSLRRCAREPTW